MNERKVHYIDVSGIVKARINELRLDAGIAHIENQQWLCVLDKETGMMIDPMIGLEMFAELIVRECADIANAGIDPNESHLIGDDIKEHFGIEK